MPTTTRHRAAASTGSPGGSTGMSAVATTPAAMATTIGCRCRQPRPQQAEERRRGGRIQPVLAHVADQVAEQRARAAW